MAFSSSVKRAQAIKICELCQEDSIKWRCIDCDMCLCEKCKTFHLRVPATAKHHIVTIGTPLQDVKRKVVLDNIPCKDHPEKMACLFCKSCDFLICSQCVSSSHKKHNFIPIESALDEKLEYLRNIYEKIDDNLKVCESQTSEVQDITSKYNATFDESLAKIKQKERELINATKEYSKDLQEKVENERSQLNAISSKIEKEIFNTKDNFEVQREEIDALLTSNQGSVIFKADMKIKDPKFNSLPNQVEQFIPETETSKKIPGIFGSLHKISYSKTDALAAMKFEVTGTFTTDLPLIDKVVTLDESSAWINCYKNKVIRKVNIQDNMVISQEVSMDMLDMAVAFNNELLLNMRTGSDLKLLERSGEIVSFLSVSPLLPRGIHVTKNNDVIVGVKEPGNLYTPTDKSQRAIIVYSMNGKQKHRYQNDKDGKRLFTYPYRITTNRNQDILVLDGTSEITGRVVVLNREGNFIWIYEGHHKINATKQFDPSGIVTTAASRIIISDIGTHAFHVLSEDGEVLTCTVISDMGVVHPWDLDIDNRGRLWLSCGTGGEDKWAKLHIIKYV